MYDTIIDGRALPPEKQYPKQNIAYRRRPMVLADQGTDLVVEKLYVGHLTQLAAIKLTPSWQLSGSKWTEYRSMTLRDVHTEDIVRTAADHIDNVYIDGWKLVPGDLTIENLSMEGTGLGIMSLFLTNGSFAKVILRNIMLKDVAVPTMIDMRCGTVGEVLIDNCPGLRVNVQGGAGSIGPITIKDSPGVVIVNNPLNGVPPNPQIVHVTPSHCQACHQVLS